MLYLVSENNWSLR